MGSDSGGGREGVERPELAPRGGVEGEDLEPRGGRVEDAVDDDRVALDLRAVVGARPSALVGPGDLQWLHVTPVDLREGRVLLVAGVAAVGRPPAIRKGGGGGAEKKEGERAHPRG